MTVVFSSKRSLGVAAIMLGTGDVPIGGRGQRGAAQERDRAQHPARRQLPGLSAQEELAEHQGACLCAFERGSGTLKATSGICVKSHSVSARPTASARRRSIPLPRKRRSI